MSSSCLVSQVDLGAFNLAVRFFICLLLGVCEGSLRDTEHVDSVGLVVFTPDSSWWHQKGEGNEA